MAGSLQFDGQSGTYLTGNSTLLFGPASAFPKGTIVCFANLLTYDSGIKEVFTAEDATADETWAHRMSVIFNDTVNYVTLRRTMRNLATGTYLVGANYYRDNSTAPPQIVDGSWQLLAFRWDATALDYGEHAVDRVIHNATRDVGTETVFPAGAMTLTWGATRAGLQGNNGNWRLCCFALYHELLTDNRLQAMHHPLDAGAGIIPAYFWRMDALTGNARIGGIATTKSGGVTVSTDQPVNADSMAALSPTASYDSYVSSVSTTANFGADVALRIGITAGPNARRAFLRFTGLSAIPAGATIVSAVLTMNCATGSASAQPFVARRCTRDIVEGTGDSGSPGSDGITYATYDGTHNWTSAGGDFGSATDAVGNLPTTTGSNAYSIPNTVAEHILTGSDTMVVCLMRSTESGTNGLAVFDSKEGTTPPSLAIVYTTDPDTAYSKHAGNTFQALAGGSFSAEAGNTYLKLAGNNMISFTG